MSCYTRNRNIDASRARERHHNNRNAIFREHRAGPSSIFQDHHYDLLAENPPSHNLHYVNPPSHNPEFVPSCDERFAGRSSAMGSSTLPTDIPSKEAVFGSNQGTVSPTSTLSFRDETVPFDAVPLAKAVAISSAEESKDSAIPFVAAHRIDDHVNGPAIPRVTNYKEDPTQRYHAVHHPPQKSYFPEEPSIGFNNPFAAERPSWLDLENETRQNCSEPTTKRGNKSQSKRWSRKFAAGTAKRSLKKKVGKESQNCL